MKFLKPVEVQAGISDGDPTNPLGISGYLLSSDGSNVNWVSPGNLSAATAETIVQPIKANEALTKGDPLYIVGYQPGQNVNIVAKADSSDAAKMPVVGLADDDYASQNFGTMTAFGSFNGDFDTTGGTENWVIGDIIFVKPGGGLTNIKPGGTDLIQNVAIVSRVNSQTGELEVIALGRTNDVPNLPTGRLFVGTAANTSLASDVIYVDDTSDRVGIGTANPSTDLEVSSTGANGIVISKTSNQAQVSGRLFFTNDTPTEGFALFNSSGTLQINSAAIPNDTSGNNKISIVGSSGNVGIGTTLPSEKLVVRNGTSNTDVKILAYNSAAGTEATLKFSTIASETSYEKAAIIARNAAGSFGRSNMHFALDSAADIGNVQFSDTKMTILYGGNVGIGVTIPQEKLHVSGGGNVRLEVESTSSFTSALKLTNTAGSYASYVDASGNLNTFDYVTSSVRTTLLSNGNFGIGTTNPNRLLTVETTGNGCYLALNSSSNNTTIGSDVNGCFVVYDDSSGTYRMVIDQTTGNVGIGTTNPFDRLEVAAANSQLRLTDTDDSRFTQFSYSSGKLVVRNNSTTTTTNQFTLDTAGNMGIGTTSPSSKLQVNGGVQLANDTAAASASKVGTFRYRTSGNNSYVDMCMQTGASTYAWVNIVQNNW